MMMNGLATDRGVTSLAKLTRSYMVLQSFSDIVREMGSQVSAKAMLAARAGHHTFSYCVQYVNLPFEVSCM